MAIIQIFATLTPADEGETIIDDASMAVTMATNLGDNVGAALSTLEDGLLEIQEAPDETKPSVSFGVFTVHLADAVKVKKLRGASAAPAITLGTGAGTGATYSFVGDSLICELTLTVGTSPGVGSGNPIATFVFAEQFATAPIVLLVIGNRAAAQRQGSLATSVAIDSVSVNGFQLGAPTTTALPAGTYKWQFIIIGK